MSSDSVLKKRLKNKKCKKGAVGDINIEINAQRNIPVMKLVADETIHLQKETNFGGNFFSKFIFIAFLCLIGMILFFVLREYNNSQDIENETELSWVRKIFNIHTYFTDHNIAEPIYDEENTEMREDQNFFEYLWQLLPFVGNEKYNSENLNQNSFNEQNIENEQDDSNLINDLNDLNQDSNDNDDEDDIYNETNENENYNINAENNGNGDDEINRNKNEDDDDEENDNENSEEDNENIILLKKYYNDDEIHHYSFRTDSFDHERSDRLNNANSKKKNFEDNGDNSEEIENHEENNNGMQENDEDYSDEEQKDIKENEESIKETENQIKEDNEDKSSNVVTKLGVGVALIFVAYVVIIRKWNHYVNENENLISTDASVTEQLIAKNLESVENELESEKQNKNYVYDEESYQNEYLDSSTASESEDSKEATMRWSTLGPDILAREVSYLKNVTSDSSGNDSDDENLNQYSKDYGKINITNSYDWQYRQNLDDADEEFDNGRITDALEKYRKIIRNHEKSVRAKYGIAKSLDLTAELQKSNELLVKVIEAYINTLLTPDVPDTLFKAAAERTINRMRFKGDYESTIGIQNLLINKFPNDVTYRNDLIVTLFMLNRISEAKTKLEDILLIWPNNGLAMVYYGFVLKQIGNLSEAVYYLSKGIESNEDGTQDGRFYFHLGDALQKLKKDEDARQVYRKGVEKGLFLSEVQRSLYNVNRLTGRYWWTKEQTTYQSFFRKLERNWKQIRNEGMMLLKDKYNEFVEESEQLREMGDWRQYELFSRGIRKSQCNKAPITCALISDFPPAAGCRRGQTKFSLMEANTHVWPHCGPTNCRLRAHLGLIVPTNVSIRVASEHRNWKEGEIMIFDDSFEHEVWHNGTSPRLILIVDVWHPELTLEERKMLTSL